MSHLLTSSPQSLDEIQSNSQCLLCAEMLPALQGHFSATLLRHRPYTPVALDTKIVPVNAVSALTNSLNRYLMGGQNQEDPANEKLLSTHTQNDVTGTRCSGKGQLSLLVTTSHTHTCMHITFGCKMRFHAEDVPNSCEL